LNDNRIKLSLFSISSFKRNNVSRWIWPSFIDLTEHSFEWNWNFESFNWNFRFIAVARINFDWKWGRSFYFGILLWDKSELLCWSISRIISEFPAIFAEFRQKVSGESRWFQLRRISPPMWRSHKHSHCDFEHESECFRWIYAAGMGITYKMDNSLKNPHEIGEKKCGLIAEMKHRKFACDSMSGPFFSDIMVSNNWDINWVSNSCSGVGDINDTGVDQYEVFTGSKTFQVWEIEDCEIVE
jgi:hypothetical protein